LLEISRQKNCWQESDLLDAADGALKEMDPRPHPWWLEILEKWLLQKVFGHQDTFEQDKSLDEISKLIRTLLKKNLPIN